LKLICHCTYIYFVFLTKNFKQKIKKIELIKPIETIALRFDWNCIDTEKELTKNHAAMDMFPITWNNWKLECSVSKLNKQIIISQFQTIFDSETWRYPFGKQTTKTKNYQQKLGLMTINHIPKNQTRRPLWYHLLEI